MTLGKQEAKQQGTHTHTHLGIHFVPPLPGHTHIKANLTCKINRYLCMCDSFVCWVLCGWPCGVCRSLCVCVCTLPAWVCHTCSSREPGRVCLASCVCLAATIACRCQSANMSVCQSVPVCPSACPRICPYTCLFACCARAPQKFVLSAK